MIDEQVIFNAIAHWEGALTDVHVDRGAWRRADGIFVKCKMESTNAVGRVFLQMGLERVGTAVRSRLLGGAMSRAEMEAFDVGMLLLRFARFGVPEVWMEKWKVCYGRLDRCSGPENEDTTCKLATGHRGLCEPYLAGGE